MLGIRMKISLILATLIIALGTTGAQARDLDSKKLYRSDTNWGVNPLLKSSINLEKAWANLTAKNQVTVAVVDTGVDFDHPYLKGSLLNGKGKGKATPLNYGKDFSKGARRLSMPDDSHGHGTHISGIIKTVFPRVKIVALKYYNPAAEEQDNLDSTVAALEYAVELGVDIINYSSGGAGASLEELRVLKKAEEKGILVVAAAGNFGSDIDKPKNHYYPASYQLPNIITVINHTKDLKLNSSSNFGHKSADLSAPGSRIKSALPKGRLGYLSGTSQSTAFVSGVAALLKSENPNLTATQIKKIIMSSTTPIQALKDKCKTGGILNAEKALNLATEGKRKIASRKSKKSKKRKSF